MLKNCELRIPAALYESVLVDLARPHGHAEERVGFLFGKVVGGERPVAILNRYTPVGDDRYLESDEFGAVIDSEAILETMQRLRDSRGTAESAFHVHMHFHKGQPSLSKPDQTSLPRLLPGFHRMSPDGVHGLLVFSLDSACAWVWDGLDGVFVEADSVAVVGCPTRVFRNWRNSR